MLNEAGHLSAGIDGILMPKRRSNVAVNVLLLVIGLGWLTAVHLLAVSSTAATDTASASLTESAIPVALTPIQLALPQAGKQAAAQTAPALPAGYVGSDTCI